MLKFSACLLEYVRSWLRHTIGHIDKTDPMALVDGELCPVSGGNRVD